jgi:hypothetical protein
MASPPGHSVRASEKERFMSRIVRIAAATVLTLGISMFSGATWAGAQEMDHGRTRPTTSVYSAWR